MSDEKDYKEVTIKLVPSVYEYYKKENDLLKNLTFKNLGSDNDNSLDDIFTLELHLAIVLVSNAFMQRSIADKA